MPPMLNSATTRDGLDENEAAVMNWWLNYDNKDPMPGWVRELAGKETLTGDEKKMFGTWAKENTKSSNAVLVKPTVKPAETGSTGSTGSAGSTGSTGTTGATGTKTTKKCKPKPKCKPSAKDEKEREDNTPTCKGPIDMGNYIRKDSIPCWSCKL